VTAPSGPGTGTRRANLTRTGLALPAGLVLAGAVSLQAGAGFADRLFAQVPPTGVTALRLWAAALILLLVGGRGTVRAITGLSRTRAWGKLVIPATFGIVLAVMNFAIYQSFARIPLGISVTVEFLGPLAVAVAGARRLISLAWAALAAIGVLLLAQGSGGHLNLAGVAFALLSAGCWACYIMLSRASGQQLPGASGLVIAMCVAALVVTGPGIAAGGARMFRPRALAMGAGIGLLSSALPYWLELEALRRVPAKVFGVWMSMQPAVAALVGLTLLGQRLSLAEWAGIACVMIASGGAANGAATAAVSAAASGDASPTISSPRVKE
jgi:inner membrane transporter RhtA